MDMDSFAKLQAYVYQMKDFQGDDRRSSMLFGNSILTRRPVAIDERVLMILESSDSFAHVPELKRLCQTTLEIQEHYPEFDHVEDEEHDEDAFIDEMMGFKGAEE